jgi:tetratricopeptide (TPR) repeat protein
VLRDLGQLQVQLKDYVGYAETRREILVAKPLVHVNWVCFAVALYLKKDHQKALECVTSFEKTLLENDAHLKRQDKSELAVFKARIHEDLGETAKAIEILSDKQLVVDQVLRCETLTRIYLSLGEKDKAIDVLEDLLMLNNSNFNYYFKILEAHGFLYVKDKAYSPEDQAKIQEILEGYGAKMPRSNAH